MRAAWIHDRNNAGVLAGLELADGFERLTVSLDLRFRNESHITAIGRMVVLFGIFHRQLSEIVPVVNPIEQHLDLLPGFSVVLRFVLLWRRSLRGGLIGHYDLRQVILRLD